MSKRPFALLEVMIALTLVALCAIPLILKPIRVYRSEMRLLEEGEGERLADWTFSEIEEQLFKNSIPWEKLPALRATTHPFVMSPAAIHVPGRKPKQIERAFTLYGKGEKEGLNGETYRMLYVTIYFRPELSRRKKKDNAYVYRVIVRRMPKNPNLQLEAIGKVGS